MMDGAHLGQLMGNGKALGRRALLKGLAAGALGSVGLIVGLAPVAGKTPTPGSKGGGKSPCPPGVKGKLPAPCTAGSKGKHPYPGSKGKDPFPGSKSKDPVPGSKGKNPLPGSKPSDRGAQLASGTGSKGKNPLPGSKGSNTAEEGIIPTPVIDNPVPGAKG